MSNDESHRSSTSLIVLPDFAGEEVLSHEGRIWKMAAVAKLAAEDGQLTPELKSIENQAWAALDFPATHLDALDDADRLDRGRHLS